MLLLVAGLVGYGSVASVMIIGTCAAKDRRTRAIMHPLTELSRISFWHLPAVPVMLWQISCRLMLPAEQQHILYAAVCEGQVTCRGVDEEEQS